MIRSRNKDKNLDAYEKLKNSLQSVTRNSTFILTSFQFDPHSIRGPVVELTNDKIVVRFIYDRGDIYRDKRVANTDQWIDELLVYNHSMPCNEIYELLLKAIKDYVGNG